MDLRQNFVLFTFCDLNKQVKTNIHPLMSPIATADVRFSCQPVSYRSVLRHISIALI